MQGASTYHREMYAITQAVGKWRQYLLGRRFTIYTDQQSLRSLTNQTIQTPEQQKWLTKLVGYDFQIVYRPGRLKQAADSLSRAPEAALFIISSQRYELEHELRTLNRSDPELLHLQKGPAEQPETLGGYAFRDDILFYRGRIVIPSASPLRQVLLAEFHNTALGGYAGIARTYHRVASNFFWKQMHKDVQSFVVACQVFQHMKDTTHSPASLLQPLPFPT